MLLERQLKELIVRQALVEVNREELTEDCMTGVIIEESMNFLYLRKFTDEGQYDGVAVMRKDDLSRIQWGGRERDAIARLISRNPPPPKRPKLKLDTFRSIIPQLSAHFGCVTVYTEELDPEICHTGELLDMDSECLLLHQYGNLQSLDRSHVMLNFADITLVESDSSYERTLLSLQD